VSGHYSLAFIPSRAEITPSMTRYQERAYTRSRARNPLRRRRPFDFPSNQALEFIY